MQEAGSTVWANTEIEAKDKNIFIQQVFQLSQ